MELEQALMFYGPKQYEICGLPQEFDGSEAQEMEIRRVINQHNGTGDIFHAIEKIRRPGHAGFCNEGVAFRAPRIAVVYA